MNRKLILGAVAGVAAIGLAVGGTTYAAYSDFGTVSGNEVDAGHLKLNLNSTGTISNVGAAALAPGESHTYDFFVASADLDGVPQADLSMIIPSVTDDENGCATNSEAVAENADPYAVGYDASTACGTTGELSQQAYFRVRYSTPTDASNITFSHNQCTAPGGYVNSLGYTPANDGDATHYPRMSYFTASHTLTTLTSGQGICVRVDVGLDANATNAVQGDTAKFDLRYDLTQS